MRNIKYIVKLFVITGLIAGQSCTEDFLDEFPSNSQSPDNITTIADAQMVLNGAYDFFQDNNYYNCNMITENDCRADDMQTAEYGRKDGIYLYRYTASAEFDDGTWSLPFALIRHVNSIFSFVENIETINEAEEAVALDIKGQALAIRALAHFDLCRMFGRQYSHDKGTSPGVPVVTTVLNPYAKEPRNTVAEVYAQVIKDLDEAIPLLSTDIRLGKINAWAAKTLLARVYLYQEENVKAYTTAVDVYENGPYTLMSRDAYVDSWSNSGGSSEAIFSVLNNASDYGGGSSVAGLSDPGGFGQFIATQDLIDLIRSDPGDIRNEILYVDQVSDPVDPTTWGRVLKYPGNGNTKAIIVANQETGSPLATVPYDCNVPVFRLSEVCLIAAEAAVKEGEVANAKKYLNAIVERANPSASVSANADVTLDRILKERRKELVAEGHRFFDLVRNKRDIVRSNSTRIFDITTPLTIKWDDFRIIFPIPKSELNINPMVQNDGYIGAN